MCITSLCRRQCSFAPDSRASQQATRSFMGPVQQTSGVRLGRDAARSTSEASARIGIGSQSRHYTEAAPVDSGKNRNCPRAEVPITGAFISGQLCYNIGMKLSSKPVHACYTCLLNLDAECWEYVCPRRQWNGRRCPGFENETLYQQYRDWLEAPHVKTRKQIRREAFRQGQTRIHHFRKVRLKD